MLNVGRGHLCLHSYQRLTWRGYCSRHRHRARSKTVFILVYILTDRELTDIYVYGLLYRTRTRVYTIRGEWIRNNKPVRPILVVNDCCGEGKRERGQKRKPREPKKRKPKTASRLRGASDVHRTDVMAVAYRRRSRVSDNSVYDGYELHSLYHCMSVFRVIRW